MTTPEDSENEYKERQAALKAREKKRATLIQCNISDGLWPKNKDKRGGSNPLW